jgi:hypothetical protein
MAMLGVIALAASCSEYEEMRALRMWHAMQARRRHVESRIDTYCSHAVLGSAPETGGVDERRCCPSPQALVERGYLSFREARGCVIECGERSARVRCKPEEPE